MSKQRLGEVLLESHARFKFLEFIVKVAIASDHDHSDFCLDIDVDTQILTIRSHVAVDSGVVASYDWPIRHTTLTSSYRLRVPAKGLVNILQHVNGDEPVWLLVESEAKLRWAAYQYDASPQLGLFEASPSAPSVEQTYAIAYAMQVKADAPQAHYQLPDMDPITTFQVEAVTLGQAFKLIHQLTQENNATSSKEVIVTLRPHDTASAVLVVYAMKHTWSCALEIPVFVSSTEPVDASEVRLSIRHASHLSGLLSAVSERVEVSLTRSHVIFSKPGWQCAFTRIAMPSWDGQAFMSSWLTMPKAQCYRLKTQALSRLVRELNIANDEKRARLILSRDPHESRFHFSVNQDRVSADLDVEMDYSFLPLSAPVSLSLWSFNTLLESLGETVYWYVCSERSVVLLADLECQRHVVLSAKQESTPTL